LVLPIIVYNLSSTNLEVRAILPGSEGVRGEREMDGGKGEGRGGRGEK
jgi:hypothetical protein